MTAPGPHARIPQTVVHHPILLGFICLAFRPRRRLLAHWSLARRGCPHRNVRAVTIRGQDTLLYLLLILVVFGAATTL